MNRQPVINKKGNAIDESLVVNFRDSLSGEMIRSGTSGYEAARRVWNGMIDRHPSMIVYCLNVNDVVRAVAFARSNDLLAAVRSGGHNVAGNAVCDDGIVIDLSRMKAAEIHESSRTATVQAGLTLGELDNALKDYHLAVPVGIVSRTGLAGLTLGGGIGWLMRKHGLTCDNLISADIVTADGNILKANTDEHPDLFWGIRGGGGNFGIVTGFTFHLHTVGRVLSGMILFPAAQAAHVLRFYRSYIEAIPDELTTMLAFLPTPPPYLPGPLPKQPSIAVHVCYSGPADEGERVLRPLRSFGKPLCDMISLIPYIKMQSMLDPGAPPGLQNYWKSSYLYNLNDQVMEIIIEHFNRVPSPLTQIHIQHLQGAVSRRGEEDSAFSNRAALCVINIVSKWLDKTENERNIQWTRELADRLEPYAAGAYINFMGEEDQDRIRSAYSAANYERLVRLKNIYDPANFFSLNQNIRPSA